MKSRLERYNDDNKNTKNISRLAKNRHLYDDLNNKIGFEELVNFDTQTRIELTSLNDVKRNRESYHQLKDYQDLIGRGINEEKNDVEQEEEKVFDINSILEEAKKNRTEIDELEKKRKLKDDDYSVLSELNKKYLTKEKNKKDEYEGLEELINTITSKTLVSDIKKEEEKLEMDLLSDLVATSVDLQVRIPEEYENNEISKIVEIDDESKIETKEIDDSFYTRSMDLSEYDFEDLNPRKRNVKKGILIALVIIVLLAIIGVVAFFVLQKIGIKII